MKKETIINWSGAIIFIIIFTWLFLIVLFPAYTSYVATCQPEKWQKFEERGYHIGGVTIGKVTPIGITQIEITIIDKSKKTLKHELIHVNQMESNLISFYCEDPIQLYFVEVEAYLGMQYPDWLFKIIYGYDLSNMEEIEKLLINDCT